MVLEKLKKIFSIRSSRPVEHQSLSSLGLSSETLLTTEQEEEEGQEETKHFSYFALVMADMRISQYFFTAEEVTNLMQASTLQFCTVIKLWRGSSSRNLGLMKLPDEDQLTQFGRWIMQASQTLGKKEEAGNSETQSQYESSFEVMITMSKESSKLRRKLARISDGFVEDLKKLKILVESRNLEENGSITNSIYRMNESGSVASSTAGSSQPISSYKLAKSRLKEVINGGSKQTRSKIEETFSNAGLDNEASRRNFVSSSAIDLKTPSGNPSKKHLKQIENEFQGCGGRVLESEPQDKKENPVVYFLHGKFPLSSPSDVSQTQPFPQAEDDDDECRAPTTSKSTNANANHKFNFKSLLMKKEKKGDRILETKSTNANEFSLGNHESSQLEVTQESNEQQEQSLTPDPMPMIDEAKSDDSVSETSESSLDCQSLLAQMQSTASSVVTQVRAVERSWLTIQKPNPDTSSGSDTPIIESKLSDLLKYIMETLTLLKRNELDSAITPERKDRMYTALDVVYKEMYTCFITVAELTQMVSTDVAYLQKLVTLLKTRLDSSKTGSTHTDTQQGSTDPRSYYHRVDINNIFD